MGSRMGSLFSSNPSQTQDVSRFPSELKELLYESHVVQLSYFRSYCQDLDGKTPRNPWREHLLDFVLLLKRLQDCERFELELNRRTKGENDEARNRNSERLTSRHTVQLQRSTQDKEMLVNEVIEKHLGVNASFPLSLSNSYLYNQILCCIRENRRDAFFIDLLSSAHNDPLVWHKLEKLYDKFLHQLSVSYHPLAVLLSIL